MAAHRAEQIMVAFVSNVMGLTTTKNSVVRDRAYNVEDGDNTALSIYQGDDIPLEDGLQNLNNIDMTLTVIIEIHVKAASTEPISKILNKIRKEITIALQAVADPPLALAWTIEIDESSGFEPQLEIGEKPTAIQRMEWMIKYRRSRTDPSA